MSLVIIVYSCKEWGYIKQLEVRQCVSSEKGLFSKNQVLHPTSVSLDMEQWKFSCQTQNKMPQSFLKKF